jgi:hypothetical protein
MTVLAIRACGLAIHESPASARPGVVIFDADPWNADCQTTLRAIRASHHDAQLIAAVGFPRPDLESQLRESGADRVWFKLAPLSELEGVVRGQ